MEHLFELRSRLGRAMLAVTVGIVVAFVFRDQVFDVIKQPYCETDIGRANCTLFSFDPIEEFSVSLRVSLIAGVLGSAPFWLYQIGAFITPALHKKEKRYAGGFLVFSLLMFATGVLFAYLTLPVALNFLFDFAENVQTLPSLRSYLSFVTLTLLAFGIAFEFPVVVLFLNFVGVLSADRLRRWRRGMVVAIAAAAAILTPSTDPYSFAALAVPLYVLYELCIVIARVRERAKRRALARDPIHQLDDDASSPAPLPSAAPVEAPTSVRLPQP